MEKEKTLCKYWQKGSCNYGTKCFNLHVGQPGTSGGGNIPNKTFNDNKNLNNQNSTGVHHQNTNNHGNNNGYNNSGANNNVNSRQPHRNNKYTNNTQNTNQSNTGGPVKNKICQYFTKPGGCDRKDACFFVHNYHESLHHVKRDIIHNSPIVGCCVICKFLKMIFIL